MNKEIKDLLARYISNQCTAEELQQVKAVLKSGLYEKEWLALMEEEAALDQSAVAGLPPLSFNAGGVFKKVIQTTAPQKKAYPYQWVVGIAAGLLVMLTAGYLTYTSKFSPKQQVYMVQQATHAAERRTIVLADGSRITLNNKSKLRYSSVFTNTKREVYLTGEAFFDVVHDVKRPFIVHTSNLKVQVLGTSFNVKSYQHDARVSVGVVTGKVGVNGMNAKKTYMLLPGNLLSCNKSDTLFKQSTVSIDEILGWQNGLLAFHQESLRDIVPELERWYNVTVHVNTANLLKKRITASFSKTPLPEVMDILSKTGGFTYTINKKKVEIN